MRQYQVSTEVVLLYLNRIKKNLNPNLFPALVFWKKTLLHLFSYEEKENELYYYTRVQGIASQINLSQVLSELFEHVCTRTVSSQFDTQLLSV